eukprot:2418440-Amphidinium_carterae.2
MQKYCEGPARLAMIDAVVATSTMSIRIIPRDFTTLAEMMEHVWQQTPSSDHIYLAGSDTIPKMTEHTITVWRDPTNNVTRFNKQTLMGTSIQRSHYGISSTAVRLAMLQKQWDQVKEMIGHDTLRTENVGIAVTR